MEPRIQRLLRAPAHVCLPHGGWDTALFRAWSQPAWVRLASAPTLLVWHPPSCLAWISGYHRLCAQGEGGTLGWEWGRPPLRRAKGMEERAGQRLTHQAQLWGTFY